jgi:hypothetical protein
MSYSSSTRFLGFANVTMAGTLLVAVLVSIGGLVA